MTPTTSTYQIATTPLTATVRNRAVEIVEIVEEGAYDAHGDFMDYVRNRTAAGYWVELSRDGFADTGGAS